MDYKIPRGTYDVLPETSWQWQVVEKAFREIALACSSLLRDVKQKAGA